jgi:hypothetical protein
MTCNPIVGGPATLWALAYRVRLRLAKPPQRGVEHCGAGPGSMQAPIHPEGSKRVPSVSAETAYKGMGPPQSTLLSEYDSHLSKPTIQQEDLTREHDGARQVSTGHLVSEAWDLRHSVRSLSNVRSFFHCYENLPLASERQDESEDRTVMRRGDHLQEEAMTLRDPARNRQSQPVAMFRTLCSFGRNTYQPFENALL